MLTAVGSRTKRSTPGISTLLRKWRSSLRRTKLPDQPAPMLCTLVLEAFDNPKWEFEPKYDGLRVLVRFDDEELTLLSRNHQSQNFQFPEIVDALRDSLPVPAVVDGEVVCFDEGGRTSFRALQQRFHLLGAEQVRDRMKRYPAYVFLFDLLHIDGYDVTGVPLRGRKEILRQLVRWSDRVLWTPTHEREGNRLLREACREGNEGIIGKYLESRYVGGRSPDWVKVKCTGRQEFVIGGFTEPQRSRVGLGALLAGYYSDDGKQLLYAGKVGTGYSNEVLLDLRHRLEKLEQTRNPFDAGDPPRKSGVHWVRPRLVAEIAFAEWTQNGLLRQPRFEGLRPDKSPRDCRRERPRRSGRKT